MLYYIISLILLFSLGLPIYSRACGTQTHPDICQGATCGSAEEIQKWLDSLKTDRKGGKKAHGKV